MKAKKQLLFRVLDAGTVFWNCAFEIDAHIIADRIGGIVQRRVWKADGSKMVWQTVKSYGVIKD